MPQQLSPRSTTVVRAVAGERRQRVDATPASMPVAAPSAGPASGRMRERSVYSSGRAGGATPSCWYIPSLSKISHSSTTRPSANR